MAQEQHGDAAEGSSDEVFGFDKRKAIVTVAVAVLLVAGAVALIGSVADFGELLSAARKANPSWFPLCALGELLAYAGYILAYRDLARVDEGPELDYWTCTKVVFAGFGAHVVGSTAGALAVDYWALHKAGAKTHEAARRVLALNTLEWAVLASYAAIASLFVLSGRGEGAPLALTLSWLVAAPVCILAALAVTQPSRVQRTTNAPESGERPPLRKPSDWPSWLWAKLRGGIADGIGGVVLVRFLLAHPIRYRAGVSGYPVYWLGDILTLYAALRAFGVHVQPAPLVLAYTTGYIVTALPLPAGGAGGIEATLSFALHLVGVPLAPALLASFVYRIFSFWLPIIPAAATLPRLKRLSHDLPETERAELPGDEGVPESVRARTGGDE